MEKRIKQALTRFLFLSGIIIIFISQSSFITFNNRVVNIPMTEETASTGMGLLAATNPFNFLPSEDYAYMRRMQVYDSLHLDNQDLNFEAFEYGILGMQRLVNQGLVKVPDIISIADFSQPSASKRLYVIDLQNFQLLYRTWVAHGRRSGKEMAETFSNKIASYKSSPGFYVTGNTYSGSHGYSLRLMGVEKGINDNAFKRSIVIHPAPYVCQKFVSSQGYIGRSEGCPAIPARISRELIDEIKDGTCLFIYSPSTKYLHRSSLLR